MDPIEVLHKQLARCVPSIHQLRLKAILAAVEAVLSGAKVTITSLGRHLGNRTLAKHKIKRMDRLIARKDGVTEKMGSGLTFQHLLECET